MPDKNMESGGSTPLSGHTFHAVSFEIVAVEQNRLSYEPPMIEFATNPDGFYYVWQLLAFTFKLRDPRQFPRLDQKLTLNERQSLQRYGSEATDLAASQLLNGPAELTVFVNESTEEAVKTSFQSKEITRGFAVSFRQFHSDGEPASFRRVHGIASRLAQDRLAESDWRELKAWGKARSQLRGRPLKVLAGQELRRQSLWNSPQIPDDYPPYPEELISLYQYGDLIHWDRKREDLSALTATPWDHAWQQMRFLEAVAGLAHLYIGYAMVIQALFGKAD
jgi:hypothetical protein